MECVGCFSRSHQRRPLGGGDIVALAMKDEEAPAITKSPLSREQQVQRPWGLNKLESTQYNIHALEGNSALGLLLMRVTLVTVSLSWLTYRGSSGWVLSGSHSSLSLNTCKNFPSLPIFWGQGEYYTFFCNYFRTWHRVKRNVNLLFWVVASLFI